MESRISPLSQVASSAQLGKGVVVGPFCLIGPDVVVGDFCELNSHVVLTGRTTLGSHNKLHAGCVIGGEPQDVSYQESATEVLIGDNNIFREGVTVNRGAEKEDHVTRIGNRNMFMANSHVAHNCRIYNDVILVNGVLLGGHVHIHDRAIVSGNTVVHHFSTIGRLSFVSGGCRVPHDIPPFMLAAGSDKPTLKTINVVGMRRAGISEHAIEVIRTTFRMLYRKHKTLAEVHEHFDETLDGVKPLELSQLLQFIEAQRAGKLGRAREVGHAPAADGARERKAA
ncbi:MAG TPA: acyl-ACP--UDP-N-acetylglucosamine O-acyltransferase [Planctomycetes bacterium]|nr:acyl-ACP--UDP-N-acetylglucosamine O-acyltransferase [Fuerstiella sp.]HIK93132.1 acyl-ACP--UDP-N-acetylglucosamine O-acyltransferase [Planctomycetota bacterium]